MADVAHHLPPGPGVTEIRVHGVGGTTPEAMLEQTGVRQAAGDTIAGFFRGATGPAGRAVEAYSWGGLTARSRSRAFWVLLLPFSLINLAGWMVEPGSDPDRRSRGTKWHEVLVQVIGLQLTAMYVMWAAHLAMNMVAFQCGAISECRSGRWYLFDGELFTDHPGRRVVAALIVPLGLLLLFWFLGRSSARQYDDYRGGDLPAYTWDNPAAGSALGRPGFWLPGKWRAQLVLAHVATVLLTLAGLLGRASREFENHFAVDRVPDLGYPLFWVCFGAGLVVFGTLGYATWRRTPTPEPTPAVRVILLAVATVAALALVVAGWLTWRLDLPDAQLVETARTGTGQVSQVTTELWGFGWAPIQLLAVGALLIGLFSVVQVWRWFVSRMLFLDQFAVVAMLAFIVLWSQAIWVAVVALATAVVAQWAPRPARPVAGWMQGWRFAVFAGICLAGAATRWLTEDAPAPFGGDGRLAPLLLFTAILLLLNLVQTSGRLNNRDGRKPRLAPVALVAVPAVLIGPSFLIYWLGGPVAWPAGAALLSWVLLAVAWLAQFTLPGFDRWRWNGPAAAAALSLATLMGTFAALATWLADLLGGDGTQFVLSATAVYEWLAVAFAGMLAIIVLGFLAWHVLIRAGIGRTGTATGGRSLAETVRAVDVVLTVSTFLLAGMLASLLLHLYNRYGLAVQQWIDDRPPGDWQAAGRVALAISLGTLIGWFLAVRRGLRDHAFRSRIGMLWDVATFFPRWFHPFAPPAYSARAVPELQTRLAEVVRVADGAVVLSAHSQGTVVAVAALTSLDPQLVERIRLVTHGSPLTRFYERFFPGYFTRRLLDDCAERLGTSASQADGGWLNFWRATDFIGDPVFGAQVREPPPGHPPPAVRDALASSRSKVTTLPDVELDDPLPPGRYAYQPQPRIRSHFGYDADPAMRGALTALADELRARLGGRPAGIGQVADVSSKPGGDPGDT
jgi:hypothetical protein